MSRFIFTVVLVAFIVTINGSESQAKGPKGSGGVVARAVKALPTPHFVNTIKPIILSKNHRNWTAYCWFNQYGAYGFYNPTAQAWYYWYQPTQSYLPVSSMTAYPPTPYAGPGVGVGPTDDNPTPPADSEPPALPQGATAVMLPAPQLPLGPT
jgi:hypothetical protein